MARLHDLEEEFEKVVKQIFEDERGCWIWLGKVGVNGYGVHAGITVYSFIYRMMRGAPEIRYGRTLHLHHLCKNKLCVNPKHLRELTAKDHVAAHRDEIMSEKARSARREGGFRQYGRKKPRTPDLVKPSIIAHTNEVSLRLATA